VTLLKNEDAHFQVPVTPNVKTALKQMLQATLNGLGDSAQWENFDCAEQHPQTASLKYAVDDPAMIKLKNLYTAQNLEVSADALSDASKIDYYSARFRDTNNNECVGVRKASYFKGTVQKSFLFLIGGQLTLAENSLFQLDPDFDFLIFSDQIVIYRPTQFERIAELEEELIKVAPAHIQTIAAAAPQLDFSFAVELVKKSPRARKLVAALKSRSDLSNISADQLGKACQTNGICVVLKDGKWTPEPKHEVNFLEMLDRRRYNDPLIEHQPAAYRAAARKKV
jgi:hypothetical protein